MSFKHIRNIKKKEIDKRILIDYYLFTLLNDEALVDVLLSDFCLILDLRLDNPLILVDPVSV